MPKTRDKLTPKQRVFVKEYASNGGNGTQASLKAYDTSSDKTAGVMAVENLGKPNVKMAIAELMEKQGLTDEYLLKKLDKGLKDKHNGTMHKFLGTALDLKGHTGQKFKLAVESDKGKTRVLLDMD